MPWEIGKAAIPAWLALGPGHVWIPQEHPRPCQCPWAAFSPPSACCLLLSQGYPFNRGSCPLNKGSLGEPINSVSMRL